MTLAAWLHDISPIIVRIWGDFAIRWYGLSYVAAFVLGWLILRWLGKRGLTRIPPEHALDAMVTIVLGTIVGGRLGYALVYDPHLLNSFTPSFPWWGLLALQQGGMASHGGLIGLCIAAWWVSRGFKLVTQGADSIGRIGRSSTLEVMDVLALMAPPGLLLGRLANFINGELLGRIASPPGSQGPWWSVMFPQELRGWVQPGVPDPHSHTPPLNTEQRLQLRGLVEDAWMRAGQPLEKTRAILNNAPAAQMQRTWREGIDLVIANAGHYKAQLSQLVSSRHASQLYQAFAEGMVLGAVLWVVAARPRKAGVVAACFFIVYGILRILTEVWRLPDPQFAEGRPFGLSRGQWLSAGMIAIGVGLLLFAMRRAGEKVGGWAAARSSRR